MKFSKNIFLALFTFCLLIFLISGAFSYCYQESANISTACGGLNTGKYDVLNYGGSVAWDIPVYNLYDGNWSSKTQSSTPAMGSFLQINYSKPSYFYNATWQVKGNTGVINLTIPPSCLNAYANTISFVIQSGLNVAWRCRNITDFSTVLYTDVGSSDVYEEAIIWDYDTSINAVNYNTSTYETSIENFIFNFTYRTAFTATVTFIYNGTRYNTDPILYGIPTDEVVNYISNTNINISLINGNSENRTFYWEIGLTNSSGTIYYNSSFYNQTVNRIFLGECNSTNALKFFNITDYNQDSLTKISPFDFKSTIYYSLGSNIRKTANFNNLSIAEKIICSNISVTYYLYGLIEHTAAGYQPNTYYLSNTPINNITTNLSLWLLGLSNSTAFIIQLNDYNNIPIPNYYVKINRCYGNSISNCTTVQSIQTDSNGQGIAFITAYDVFYQFEVYDTIGNKVLSTDARKISLQSSPYTITLTTGSNLPNPISYFSNISNLIYNINYTANTGIVQLNYIDTNTSFTYANLLVSKFNASGNDLVICNSTNYYATAIIICNVSGNDTGEYSAKFYLKRGSTILFVDNLIFEIETFASSIGKMGLLAFFFLLLIAGFAFSYNHIASIVMVDVVCIFSNFIGFVHLGIVPLTSILALSIIMLVILEKD